MKRILTILSPILFLFGLPASADPVKAKQLIDEQKREIAWAIRILERTGTISNDNMCVQFDQDILQELVAAGLLKKGNSVLLEVCQGGKK